jgi:hypothetical protein
MLASAATYEITWEKLPDDFVLDDEPVDNINQPLLAAALTESLEVAGRLPANALTITNYAICATLNNRIVVKAPDLGFVRAIACVGYRTGSINRRMPFLGNRGSVSAFPGSAWERED